MNISSLSGLSGLQQQQNLQKTNAKLGAAIAALVSANKISSASSDVASLSIASQLRADVSGLRQASGNLAQAGSLAQVADGGLQQLLDIAENVQTLAQQAASPIVSDENRKALDAQFKQLRQQAASVVANTSFNGKKLLDGNVSGEGAVSLDALLSGGYGAGGESLSIDGLSALDLLTNDSLNLASAEGAGAVLAAADGAVDALTATRANIGSFLQAVDYAAASVATATANQDAARSTLEDTDFAEASSQLSQASLQQNAAIALAAQGNRIPSALLQLVG